MIHLGGLYRWFCVLVGKSTSSVHSHLRYILTAGVAVLFLLWICEVREKSLGVSFSNFINFMFQPFRFVCKSDVRQIFVGLNSIVREIYVLSFEIVVFTPRVCCFLFSIPIFNRSIPIWHYHIIPVYSHSLLSRFAPFAAFAGPFLRRLCPTPLS